MYEKLKALEEYEREAVEFYQGMGIKLDELYEQKVIARNAVEKIEDILKDLDRWAEENMNRAKKLVNDEEVRLEKELDEMAKKDSQKLLNDLKVI